MNQRTRILCCCHGGRVRSVAAKYLLNDRHGLNSVLAVGLAKIDVATFNMLADWADLILVVGEQALVDVVPSRWSAKVRHLDVGPDIWGPAGHNELVTVLRPLVASLVEVL